MGGNRSENFQHIDQSATGFEDISKAFYRETYLRKEAGPWRPEDETDPETGLTHQETAERHEAESLMKNIRQNIQRSAGETEAGPQNPEAEEFLRFTGMEPAEAVANLMIWDERRNKLAAEKEQLSLTLETLGDKHPKYDVLEAAENPEHKDSWAQSMSNLALVKNRLVETQAEIESLDAIINETKIIKSKLNL